MTTDLNKYKIIKEDIDKFLKQLVTGELEELAESADLGYRSSIFINLPGVQDGPLPRITKNLFLLLLTNNMALYEKFKTIMILWYMRNLNSYVTPDSLPSDEFLNLYTNAAYIAKADLKIIYDQIIAPDTEKILAEIEELQRTSYQ